MAELFPSRAAMELQGQSLANNLRNIMLLVRQLREGGYEVKPEGLAVVEGIIFTETKRLSDYLDQVAAIFAGVELLKSKGRDLIATFEETDAEIAEMTSAIRGCLHHWDKAKSPKEAAEICELIARAVDAIDARVVRSDSANPLSNVVQFPLGGAA